MKRALATSVFLLLATAAAPAAANDAVSCSFSVHLTFDPGISTPRSAGTFSSDGPGTVSCSGMLGAMPIVGEGGLVVSGSHRPAQVSHVADADCLDGVSTMRITTRVRDAIGFDVKRWRRVSGAVRLARTGWSWNGGHEAHGGRSTMSLASVLSPDEGQDCWNRPVTGGTLSGRFVVRR